MYDLQDLLAKQGMPDLLGKKANLRLLSSSNVTIGKVLAGQFWEMKSIHLKVAKTEKYWARQCTQDPRMDDDR